MTVEKTLHGDQRRVIEQAKFTYPPLGKSLEKQLKKTRKKASWSFRSFKTQYPEINNWRCDFWKTLREEAKNEFNKVNEIEKTIERENLVYSKNEYTYHFKNFGTLVLLVLILVQLTLTETLISVQLL